MVNLATLKYGRFRYNSPWTQVVIVGLIAFCSVGMFSALSNLGAGGTQDVHLSNIANSVLYGCFFIGGFFAGSINNTLGPRLTMSLGTTGYALYVGAVWNFQVSGNRWFFILAGAILGITASLFWAAQGAVMMSYPTEKDKGRSFSLFWGLFQMGTLIGASITLGIQANSTLPSVSTAVYVVFLIIMLIGIALSWLVLPPHLVVRGDQTIVELDASLSPKQEFQQFLELFKDWRMLALFPMFFSSNYFYAYQNALTAALFNGRTRALVALLTGLGSILGSFVIGMLTDTLPMNRRLRAVASCGVVFALMCTVWGGGLGFQLKFTRSSEVILGEPIPWDWTVGAAIGPIILMLSYYVVDAAWQGLAYYTMSSITNNPFRLARMAGYYKGIQSAGAAVSFGMEAARTPYLGEHLISWLLVLISMPFCALVLYKIRETNYEAEEVVTVDDAAIADKANEMTVKVAEESREN
ncbi:major facilitator superfamily protein [Sarocladium implicatum]|nr:major facilitator superfamily protein [Sarocladium implicatum]